MSIDWTKLAARTKNYDSVRVTSDPGGGIVDVVATGLRVKLSDLVAKFPDHSGATLSVYADTLVVDAPSFSARGVAICARRIEIDQDSPAPLTVQVPATDTAAVSILAGGVTGGLLQLVTEGGDQAPFTVPAGTAPLQVVYYFVAEDGTTTTDVTAAPADVEDMVGRPWPLSALLASFTAATWLMSSTSADDLKAAHSMLAWVVAATGAVKRSSDPPGAFLELYDQAASLLVTLNVRPGARFVPVLSREFYKSQVDQLVNALESYENGIATLRGASDLKAAVESVSSTLQGIASDEVKPLETDLKTLETNLENLATAVRDLNQQFDLQAIDVNLKYTMMINKIANQQVIDWLKACVQMAISIAKIAVAVASMGAGAPAAGAAGAASGAGGGAGAAADAAAGGGGDKKEDGKGKIGDIAKEGFGLIGTAYKAISDVMKDPQEGQRPLLKRAQELVTMQQALMTNFLHSIAVDVPESAPDDLGEFAVDPTLAWNNYAIEVEAALDGVGSVASDYKVSLLILINFAKAVDAKVATYAGQRARASVVRAQIAAAKQAQERWKQLAESASSDEERLDGLIGVLQARADAIKRTAFAAWTRYEAAWFYLYFEQPPVTVDLDMSAAQLRDAFGKVDTWIGKLIGDDPGTGTVELPNENVAIDFEFDILPPSAELTTVNTALLAAAQGSQPASLTWTIPMGTDQLKGVLPHGGNVAVWITEAEFFVDGVQANDRGRVMVSVATSGTYQNGFGPQVDYAFVTKPMVGDYAYIVNGGEVYNQWRVAPEVYMTPTPFTQWTMTFDPDGGDPSGAKKLRMKLRVAYRSTS